MDAVEASEPHRESVVAPVCSSATRRRPSRRYPFLDPRHRVELVDAVPEVLARAEAW